MLQKIDVKGLRQLMKRHAKEGFIKGNVIGGTRWCIVKGDGDVKWTLYLNGKVLIRCVSNRLSSEGKIINCGLNDADFIKICQMINNEYGKKYHSETFAAA